MIQMSNEMSQKGFTHNFLKNIFKVVEMKSVGGNQTRGTNG